MNILCLTPWFPSYPQDQAGNFILDSINALTELDHNISVLVTQPWRPKFAAFIDKNWVKRKINTHDFSERFTLNTCHHFSIPRNYFRPLSNFFYHQRVASILEDLAKKNHCDLIHAHTEIPGWVAVNVGKKIGIPTIVTLHGINTDRKLYLGKTRQQLFEQPLEHADRVILVGEPLIHFFKNFVSQHDHFRVIHNGFRLTPQHANLKNKHWPTHLRFISVSNLHEGKGIDLNLQALAKLKLDGIKNWTYKIIGDGYQKKQLEAVSKNLNLNEQVSFLGACPHDKVYDHLATSDIFILPSYREAFGIAYLEAMSFGLLTIGIKGQGPQAFIEHEKTGLLAPPQDIDALIAILKSIFISREKMQAIAEAGKKHVHEYFTWHRHAKNLTGVYRELKP